MKGWFTFQEFSTRINKDIPFFFGANYIYINNTLEFNLDLDKPIFNDIDIARGPEGLSMVYCYWE